jgi:transcriptional regulator with XRE-family HTH domain
VNCHIQIFLDGCWKPAAFFEPDARKLDQKLAGISPRILSEFENGSGNPTLATMEKIALPFGLKVTFLPPVSWRLHAQKDSD